MAKEIERKFLVTGDEWREGAAAIHTRQGYLSSGPECTVRVRLQGEKAFLTIKGKTQGVSRDEYEYPIPPEDAAEMLDNLCPSPQVEKNRYHVTYAGIQWEVDEFLADNAGLIVAEVELESEDQQVELPPWAGEEVSHDPKYRNVSLVRHPFSTWGK
ncbi:CYTH domain-containing protein [Geomonas sp. Red32]|uniref:CYTH domain-containing protein n=1 Tax=Geomonas sp. Red32 TaxID=2912856 RepID=UPI00202CC61F|nr:CYTH domain-containing protein [Geomonas sp. Red32]MCM0082428.1 CYTH domain-containing protein [Geomonas sp. Red32]